VAVVDAETGKEVVVPAGAAVSGTIEAFQELEEIESEMGESADGSEATEGAAPSGQGMAGGGTDQ
jgi:hypothetical protein